MFGRFIMAAAVAATFFGANAAMTTDAEARANCKQRDQLVATLSQKYKESRRGYGLSNKYQVLELYASDNGTWTAVVTTPDGKSCIVAAGEAWTEQKPIPAGEQVSFTH